MVALLKGRCHHENLEGVKGFSQSGLYVALWYIPLNGAPAGTFASDVEGGNPRGGINGPWGLAVDGNDTVWVANFGPLAKGSQFTTAALSQLAGTNLATCPPGLKTGDPISPPTGYTLASAGEPVLLSTGEPLYGPGRPASYSPLMRQTSCVIDAAGNVWTVNNWKPDFDLDMANPGGDGVVIFVGVAKPKQRPSGQATPHKLSPGSEGLRRGCGDGGALSRPVTTIAAMFAAISPTLVALALGGRRQPNLCGLRSPFIIRASPSWYPSNMSTRAASVIHYPPEILWALQQEPQEFEREARLQLALKLYEQGRLSTGLAARLAGLPKLTFLFLLGQHGLSPVGVDPDELEGDLDCARRASRSE